MGNLITHSLTFSKESVSEYFIKPIFVANDIRDIVSVRTDIKNSEKMDFIDSLEKITKAYQKGTAFTPATGITITQKTLSVVDMKAEVEQNGKAFLNQVKESLLKKGVDENDVSDTLFEQIILELFADALMRDMNRQAFFGDVKKEDIVGGVPDGSLDADYKEYDGFFTRIYADIDSGAIAAGQFVDINSTTYLDAAAVKQKATVTLTGSSGTANININGVDYLATFDSDLATTATNFVSSHAATVAARFGKLAVTADGDDVVIEAGIAGQALQAPTIANASGNLAGSVAATTANVATGDIKTDGAKAMMESMWKAMPTVLRARVKREGRFMVTASIADNYRATLEDLNGSEAAHTTLLSGQQVLTWRGIPIVERVEWDEHIESDFASARPHRALLTIPANMVIGTDGVSDDANIELFYDQRTQDNVFRVEYKAGTQYIHPEYIVAAHA